MRIKSGSIRHRKKKRIFKEAEGRVGGRGRLWRTVIEHVVKGRVYAYNDRECGSHHAWCVLFAIHSWFEIGQSRIESTNFE